MINLTKISSFGIKSLSRISYHGNLLSYPGVNKTIIRTKRQVFSRRPVKIVTDSGKDYFQQNNCNEYSDEDFDEEFIEHYGIDAYMNWYEDCYLNNKRQSDDSNERRDKFEKVLKPKIPGIPVYDNIYDNNSQFVSDILSLKKGEENLMLLEGKRLICDAIDANIKIKTIYFTEEENLIGIQDLNQLVSKGVQFKRVLYSGIQRLSELSTGSDVVAVSERPNQKSWHSIKSSEQTLPLILIGDNIRDPTNLGTMVRCAAAVGANKLVLLKGCADVWQPKVLGSGAGAHFRIPIVADIEWPLVFNHLPIGKPFDLFIAESNDDLNNKNVKNGNISEIPLNTINTMSREMDYSTKQTFLRDESYNDSNPDLYKYRNLSIATTSYLDTKFYTLGIERPTLLVIGGETQGLSNQSYKLAYDYSGRKIKIPFAVGVDSLNSAIASAVIMYEIKRQFECRHNSGVETIV